ncbi:MAG: flagellar basal body rod protein FlgB [Steroidobacteraceae bacterium]|mgnify:CR=1 FL=1
MLENLFGVHEKSMLLRGERSSVLASNLANADTPNYKARDFDFAAVMATAGTSGDLVVARTSQMHLGAGSGAVFDGELKYRIPYQPSLDGNTVEAPVEQAAFAENAVRYQASLMFINRRIASLETALTGQ